MYLASWLFSKKTRVKKNRAKINVCVIFFNACAKSIEKYKLKIVTKHSLLNESFSEECFLLKIIQEFSKEIFYKHFGIITRECFYNMIK